jgi:hypothetical protein
VSADYNSVAESDSELDDTLDDTCDDTLDGDSAKDVPDAGTIDGRDGELEDVGADPCEPPSPDPVAGLVVVEDGGATLLNVPLFLCFPTVPPTAPPTTTAMTTITATMITILPLVVWKNEVRGLPGALASTVLYSLGRRNAASTSVLCGGGAGVVEAPRRPLNKSTLYPS